MDRHAIPVLDAKGLRRFAFTMSVLVILLFGFLFPYLFGYPWPIWPWIIAAVFVLWGGVFPLTFKPIYTIWMSFGLLMSKITTPLILGIMFFLLITPVALLMRLVNKDPMERKLESNVNSYRVIRDESIENDFKRPF